MAAKDNEHAVLVQRRWDRMRAWGAVFSGGGAVVSALALIIGLIQFNILETRWRKDTAIRAIEGESVRPFTSKHCLGAFAKLTQDQVTSVHDRRRVVLKNGQPGLVAQCFSDLDDKELSSLYEKNSPEEVVLSPRGSSNLAQRVNAALDKDVFLASLINNNVADRKLLLDQYAQRLCIDEKDVVFRVEQLGSEEKAIVSPLRQFIDSSCRTAMERNDAPQ
jgi:hypothetical protein